MPDSSSSNTTNAAGALAAAQVVLGTIQTVSGANRAKRLRAERTSYHTPDEIFKILQATQSLASGGFDPATLSYLTNQTDQAFGQSIGTITRLGGNANDLGAAFQKKVDAIMKIGAENHALNMQNFSKYLDALNLVSENKAAEWKSKQDMIKDDLQAAVEDKQSGIQNIFGGANAFLGASASGDISKLYTTGSSSALGGGAAGAAGGDAAAAAAAAGSDIRLKENYRIIGRSRSGINIYEFSYKGDSRRFHGVMAHEVPQAAFAVDGFLWVDYSKIDVEFKQL